MRKIKNVHLHEDPEKYNCFGCAPHNQLGLHLDFWEDGDEVFTLWEPKPHLMGWVNVLHGGIQATLMDEVSGWLVYVKCATVGVTAELNVKYRKPMFMDRGPLKVISKLREKTHRMAIIDSRIEIDGVVHAEGVLKFFLFSEQVAREQYYYPGVEAFFES
ncbi:MAG: PaaI family thioesterase [Prolixibacteraceae bacterium]|nr:PaaI family thioesterase [Prolixibacteraceae bacterium]